MRRPLAHIATAAVATSAVATAAVLALAGGCTAPAPTPDPERTTLPYWDATLPVPDRETDLLARLAPAEKARQRTQGQRAAVPTRGETDLRLGSVLSGDDSAPSDNTPAGWADMMDGLQQGAAATPLGIPLLYGVDAVHGNQSLYGATIYPHNIGLGAAGDPDLVQRIARATAVEMAATGVNWTFGPCVAVVQDIRWGRSYESFGSDPALVSAMTTAITGYQEEGILATAKHYLADGGTAGGVDQGDASRGATVGQVVLGRGEDALLLVPGDGCRHRRHQGGIGPDGLVRPPPAGVLDHRDARREGPVHAGRGHLDGRRPGDPLHQVGVACRAEADVVRVDRRPVQALVAVHGVHPVQQRDAERRRGCSLLQAVQQVRPACRGVVRRRGAATAEHAAQPEVRDLARGDHRALRLRHLPDLVGKVHPGQQVRHPVGHGQRGVPVRQGRPLGVR